MPIRLNCPYCNSGQSVDELPESGRVTCPRCGESYPADAHIDADWSSDNALSVSDTPVSPASNWTRVLLIGVILMLGIGGTIWWFNGVKDEEPTPIQETPPSAATVPPKAIAGLKVIPSDAAIVATIQPARLRAFTDNAPSLPGFADDWQTKPLLTKIENLGIDLNHVNNVVIAVVLSDDSVIPNLFVVLDLSKPLGDEQRFFDAIGADRFKARSGETYYKTLLWNFPMTLDRVDATTYYFASRIEDLGREAHDDFTHLAKGVRESIDQLSPASVAWAVTDYRTWQEQASVKALRRLQNDDNLFREWNDVRALALSLSFEPTASATVSVRAFDANAAQRFEELLVEKLIEKQPLIQLKGEWAEARLTLSKVDE